MKRRLAALALCLVFTGTLFAAPKARAVVAEAAATAIGVAVLGSYLAASGLSMTVDSADTVTSGLESLASDYVAETGAADDAVSWLTTIADLVSVPSDGVLRLPAAVVCIVGAFTDWLTETFGLTEKESDIGFSFEKGYLLADGSYLDVPSVEGAISELLSNYPDLVLYPIPYNLDLATGAYLHLSLSSTGYLKYEYCTSTGTSTSGTFNSNYQNAAYVCFVNRLDMPSMPMWHVYFDKNLSYLNCSSFLCELSNWGTYSSGSELSISRGDSFAQIADEISETSNKNLNIYVPSTITTLDDLASTVPDQIASNTFNVTYELTQEGTGEGTDTEDGTGADDTTVGLLQSILQGVKAIPDAFTNSLTDVFTPSQEAIDSLSAEVDAKLPIIPTLQNFGDTLVYNLEHPEECANGLGLTTVVDLGKGRGTYLGDTTHDLLDVSWYLEYKSLVDDLIVGFCWLCFLWNCYGALPRIIHGEGSVITVKPLDFDPLGAGSGVKELGKGK